MNITKTRLSFSILGLLILASVFVIGSRNAKASRGVSINLINGGATRAFQLIDDDNGVVCYAKLTTGPYSCVKK